MASSRPVPEAPEAHEASYEPTAAFGPTVIGPHGAGSDGFGPKSSEPWDEWNPTEDSVRPVRGRHRVGKQRGGMARSSAVLGVGMIAAVGAGGMATAKDKPPAPISLPDLGSMANDLPDAADLPGVGGLFSESTDSPDSGGATTLTAPLTQAGFSADDAGAGQTDAGEALRARILQQADQQQAAADRSAAESAAEAAAEAAAEDAAAQAAKEAKEAAAKKAAAEKAEEERKRKAAAEAARKAEEERLAKLARSFSLPLTSYQLTSGYGASGSMWSSNHTGQDFAAPTGTPVKAVHSGEIVEAGWAGSYGYRIVLKLDDGTEIWYCHLSSMTKTSGSVTTGDVIGNVGSTGNSSGPHLHLEVRPGGGDPIDPLSWLRSKGLSI